MDVLIIYSKLFYLKKINLYFYLLKNYYILEIYLGLVGVFRDLELESFVAFGL